MEKGKWHKVNGKLVRKRNRRANNNYQEVVSHTIPIARRNAEQQLNNWWNGLSLSEKLSKALEGR